MTDREDRTVPEPHGIRENVEDELSFHLEMRARELEREEGLDPAAARREARQRFGDMRSIKDDCQHIDGGGARELKRMQLLGEIRQDVKLAARRLLKTPGFALVAVLTLALGIGANSAIFSVVNGVVLQPLPYPEPDRLVQFWESAPKRGWDFFSVSQPNYLDFRDGQSSFVSVAAVGGGTFNLTGDAEPERLAAGRVTASFLPTIGLQPVLGRSFTQEEDAPGAPARVAMLGYGLWQRRFAGDESILAESILLDGEPYTVIGVLPNGEQWFDYWDVVVPLAPSREANRGDHRLAVYCRMKPGVTVEQAEADLDGIAAGLAIQYPDSNEGFDTRAMALHDSIVDEDLRSALYILLAAVGVVLLIACVNIANLLLARAAGHQRELAICAALGASRARMMRQMLAESLLLAFLGGAAGTALGYVGIGIFRSMNEDQIPRFDILELDATVLIFTLVVTIATGVLAGLLPAWQATSRDMHAALQDATRGAGSGHSAGRTRKLLLAAEIALSVVLLVGAGLLLRSFYAVQSIDPGLDTDPVLSVALNVPVSMENDQAAAAGPAFYRSLLEALEARPGIERAAAISGLPFGGGNTSMDFLVTDREPDPDGITPSAFWRLATPGYFETMGISLVKGRFFTDADGLDSGDNVVISQRMAELHWPGEDPIGKTFLAWRSPDNLFTVIGVAGDVRERSLESEAYNIVYMPFYRFPFWSDMYLMLRSAGDPTAIVGEVRAAVEEIDPELPLAQILPMRSVLDSSLAQRRFNTSLLGAFAALALLLAAGGVYGVMAYSVARRVPEIGVRMAMGAQAKQVVTMIIGQGMRVVAAGGAIGLIAALAVSRLLASLLFGVEPSDPLTIIGVIAFLATVALLACLVPALRATRIDPVHALRSD